MTERTDVVGPYLALELPAEFVLEFLDVDGTWIDWGLFQAETFERQPDGSYVCAGHGGSPLFLRCIAIQGNVIDAVDGAGKSHRYRIVPFPGGGYQRR